VRRQWTPGWRSLPPCRGVSIAHCSSAEWAAIMGKQRKIAIIQVFFDRNTKRDFSEFLQRRGSGRRREAAICVQTN
jgi:hypothetical protein